MAFSCALPSCLLFPGEISNIGHHHLLILRRWSSLRQNCDPADRRALYAGFFHVQKAINRAPKTAAKIKKSAKNLEFSKTCSFNYLRPFVALRYGWFFAAPSYMSKPPLTTEASQTRDSNWSLRCRSLSINGSSSPVKFV